AGFFVLCNGRRLKAFRTIDGPTAPATIDLSYEQIGPKFQVLLNTLGPEGLRRAVSSGHIDTKQPLAKGLASTAHIVGGFIEYQEATASSPEVAKLLQKMRGMRLQINSGYAWRLDNQIAVTIEQGHFHAMHAKISREMGVGKFL